VVTALTGMLQIWVVSEVGGCFVRFNHVANVIVNANHSIV
jgi:hypothetical protein